MGTIYLTSRNKDRGMQAVQQLESEGCNTMYHQLDIESFKSIQDFKQHLMSQHSGLDILVNNAGVKIKDDKIPAVLKSKMTMSPNSFGTLNASNPMLPIVKPQGRLINV